jgi:hypothetical protein
MVFGRLRSDATPGQASAELNGIAAQLVAEHGASAEAAAADRGRHQYVESRILAAGASSA